MAATKSSEPATATVETIPALKNWDTPQFKQQMIDRATEIGTLYFELQRDPSNEQKITALGNALTAGIEKARTHADSYVVEDRKFVLNTSDPARFLPETALVSSDGTTVMVDICLHDTDIPYREGKPIEGKPDSQVYPMVFNLHHVGGQWLLDHLADGSTQCGE